MQEEESLSFQMEELKKKKSRTQEERQQLAQLKKRLKEIDAAVEEAAKPLIRRYFDYEIPVAMVEDAGITSAGTLSAGNQLPQLQEEFFHYRQQHPLWENRREKISYRLSPEGELFRLVRGQEENLI